VNKKNILLNIKKLSTYYGSIKAVKEIDLRVDKGEIVSLIGPNGAGKTTILNSILNIPETKGKIIYKRRDISSLNTSEIVSKGISLIPEGHLGFTSMSVKENLQIGAYHGQGGQEDFEKIYQFFPILEKRKNQPAGTLSGGEQQMLSIGRALLSDPELILVDEPSLGLAPKITDQIFDIFVSLQDEGYTILLAEQNVRRSLEIADRGYILETGSVLSHGATNELSNNIKKAYLGSNV
jgi:branched-chain amino acid transport system ATP-binding protein